MKIFGRTKQQHQEDGGSVATMDATETKGTEMTPAAELERVQDEITVVQAELSRLEGQSRGHSELIAALDAESVALKEKLAGGDTGVTVILDEFDRRRLDSVRKLEGIRHATAAVEMRLAPLSRRARDVAQVADTERQDRAVARFETTVEQLAREILEGWRTACIRSFELVTTVEDAISTGNFDASHRSRVLAANERLNLLFQQESLKPVNENWIRRESHLFRRLNIQAARPK